MFRKGVRKLPELSRFGGMVIYLLFHDIGQHNSRMSMFIMESMRPRLRLTESCWQVPCRTNS